MTFTPQLHNPDAIFQTEWEITVVFLLVVDMSIETLLNQFNSNYILEAHGKLV